MNYMHVVTTSGSATGAAADKGKIQAMKAAMRDFSLAIASGITPENAVRYLKIVDCFPVATGIGKSWTELDPSRVKALVDAVRALWTSDV